MKYKLKVWYLIITSVIALMALVMATYAWFTTNRTVSAGTATAGTGEEALELQISANGGVDFKDSDLLPIPQLNSTASTSLTPVSTVNLTGFVYCPNTVEGNAVVFKPVENENGYYHGRIYLRAVGDGWPDGSKMELYLDSSDGVFWENVNGNMLNASRLGLIFDENPSSAVILRLSDEQNPNNEQAYNTVVDGTILGAGQVLAYNNGNISAENDPSSIIDDYIFDFSSDEIKIPEKSLLSMEFDRIYQMDIYFYLEGCDPDCSDSISFDAADIHLAFYGILN